MDSELQPDDEHADPRVLKLRSEPRQSMLLLAVVRRPGGPDVPIKVRNLSAGGLMAECPGGFARDTAVECVLRGLGVIPGRIAWAAQGRIGVQFEGPVDVRLARVPVQGLPEPQLVQVSRSTWRPGVREIFPTR